MARFVIIKNLIKYYKSIVLLVCSHGFHISCQFSCTLVTQAMTSDSGWELCVLRTTSVRKKKKKKREETKHTEHYQKKSLLLHNILDTYKATVGFQLLQDARHDCLWLKASLLTHRNFNPQPDQLLNFTHVYSRPALKCCSANTALRQYVPSYLLPKWPENPG